VALGNGREQYTEVTSDHSSLTNVHVLRSMVGTCWRSNFFVHCSNTLTFTLPSLFHHWLLRENAFFSFFQNSNPRTLHFLGLFLISAFLCAFISIVHASSLCFLGFFWFCRVAPPSLDSLPLSALWSYLSVSLAQRTLIHILVLPRSMPLVLLHFCLHTRLVYALTCCLVCRYGLQ